LQIAQAHVPTLARQTIGQPQILMLIDFHPPNLCQSPQ
jgi:aminoglycoside/choline kinase family phosphotransferase